MENICAKRAVAWGVVAAAIAFWVNLLLNKGQFPEVWSMLLVAPVVEEVAKYLGIRRVRSVVVPIVFLACESLVQVSGNLPLVRDVWVVWLFYIPFGVIMLKHILFYIVMYLCNFGLHGLVLAIVAHFVWNWYVLAPQEWEAIPLGLIVLAVTVLPVAAMYKLERQR